jgi:hypothetical protein
LLGILKYGKLLENDSEEDIGIDEKNNIYMDNK